MREGAEIQAPESETDRSPEIASQEAKRSTRRVTVVDSLRFVLAAWVVLGHFGFSPLRDALIIIHAPRLLKGIPDSMFNGGAAVMAFFAISGFCIHLPFAGSPAKLGLRYYLRRETRLLPPVVVMLALSAIYPDHPVMNVIWSLICEEIYYLLYPLLRVPLRTVSGQSALFGALCAASLIAIVLRPGVPVGASGPGYFFDWLVYFPIWFGGAIVAEWYARDFSSFRAKLRTRTFPVGVWRTAMFLFSWGIGVVDTVHPNGRLSSVMFLALGLACVLWLTAEIDRGSQKDTTLLWLERLGMASYSLYLTHTFVLEATKQLFAHFGSVGPDYVHHISTAAWVVGLVGTAALTWLLYTLVERPAHRLARRIQIA
jgi:peptidoglycan/LPS O-acetylase OafA/YrhL